MNTSIGADATRLVGLLIATLQMVQGGQMTLEQWERFNNLSTDDREARFGNWKKPEPTAPAKPTDLSPNGEKFALLVDLGIITVPDNYVHANQLTTFVEQNCNDFYRYNDNITDKNYSGPTRILKPGDQLRVRVFKQVVDGTTTSEERMAFLATQHAIYTGAQGASLVFDQKREQLPKGNWYASFDEKGRLWVHANGIHKVPSVVCYSDKDFSFDLADFECDWDGGRAFLCFNDI